MKNVKWVLLLFALTYISAPLFANRSNGEAAPDFCIANEADYHKHREELPKYLQTLPVVVGGEKRVFGFPIIAVIKLSISNGVLVFSSDLWKLGSRYNDKAELKNVCVYKAQQKMILTFLAKNEKSGKIENVVNEVKFTDTEFIAEDFALRSLSPADHKALKDKIIEKETEKTGKKPADEVVQ